MAILIHAVPFLTLSDGWATLLYMACGAALYALAQELYTSWRQS